MNRRVSETRTSNGIKIKYLFNQNRKQINPNSLEGIDVCHYSIPNVQEFGKGVIENGTDIESNKFLIEQEQLLVSKLNPRKRTVCLSHPEETVTVCSTEFISLFPKEKNVDLNYSRYVFMMSETTELLDSMVESVTRSHQRIQPEKFENLYFPLPPLQEQQLISRYLDKKTEQIDSLIDKIQKKIERLKEQRTSLINQCVTKGLDPNVERKDSGVEWIGEIPQGWISKRLKYLLTEKPSNGIFKKKDDFGHGTPLINVSDVFTDNFLIHEEQLDRVICDESEKIKFGVKKGDQFFIRSSLKLEGIGVSSMYSGDNPTVFECHIVKVSPDPTEVCPRFLNFYLNSRVCRDYFIRSSQTVTMTTISQDPIKECWVICPPLPEQEIIVKELEKSLLKITRLSDTLNKKILLLREYRQSLISSAVTGKIRVTEDMV